MDKQPVDSVLDQYDDSNHAVITEWLENLEKLDLGFFCKDPSLFPQISMHYETPEVINNCIIEYGINSDFDWKDIYKQLAMVGCKFLEIRITKNIDYYELEDIIAKAKNTNIRGIELLIPFQSVQFSSKLKELLLYYQRIVSIIIHSIPKKEYVVDIEDSRLAQTLNDLSSNTCCGSISKENFVSNLSFFTEAQSFNTCLNKKVSISKDGLIKNCPSLKQSYGNVKIDNILDVVIKQDFRKK